MRARSARFDRVVAGSHTLATRVDVLFNRQTILEGLNVTGGEITFDAKAPIMARGMLDVAEPTRLPTVGDAGVLSPYGYEVRIWQGVRYQSARDAQTIVTASTSDTRITEASDTRVTEAGDTRVTEGDVGGSVTIPGAAVDEELLSLGVFGIQRSSFNGVTLEGQLDLLDRSKQVIDAQFEAEYVIPVGTNGATAIMEMIDAGVSGLTYAFESTPYTLPAIVFSAGDDRWEAAQAIATAIGCEVFFNGDGWCVLRQQPGADATPVFAIVDGEGGNLTALSLDLDREPAFNRVIATGENATNSEVFRAVATDDDPQSPTAYDGPFGRKPMQYPSPHIGSLEQAEAAAQGVLTAVSGVARSVDVQFVPHPALEPGDVVQITLSNPRMPVNELYIIDGYTLSLTAEAVSGMGMVFE